MSWLSSNWPLLLLLLMVSFTDFSSSQMIIFPKILFLWFPFSESSCCLVIPSFLPALGTLPWRGLIWSRGANLFHLLRGIVIGFFLTMALSKMARGDGGGTGVVAGASQEWLGIIIINPFRAFSSCCLLLVFFFLFLPQLCLESLSLAFSWQWH